MHLLNTSESNAADSICKEIVHSLMQNNKEVKTAPNITTKHSPGLSLLPKNKEKYQQNISNSNSTREENVEIKEIKKLISSLGEPSCSIDEPEEPLEKGLTLNEIPKPSCGRSFQSKEGYESDRDEEQLFNNNHKKKKMKRKRTKCSQNTNMLKARSISPTPRALSASEQSHFYGLPNLVQNLSSLGNVQNNIKLILNKVVKRINKTSDDVRQQPVPKLSIDNRRSDTEISNISVKETNILKEYCSLKRNSSTETNNDYPSIKCRRLDCDALLFDKVPEEHKFNSDDNKKKVFGYSTLNPYKSASFTIKSRHNKRLIVKRWKSDSGLVKVKTIISDFHYREKINNNTVLKDVETNLTRISNENKQPPIKNISPSVENGRQYSNEDVNNKNKCDTKSVKSCKGTKRKL